MRADELKPIENEMRIAAEEVVEQINESQIGELGEKYDYTGNALYVWEAIRFCSEYNKSYPDWVNNYLAECASNLMSVDEKQAKGDYKKQIVQALNMSSGAGQSNIFRQYNDWERLFQYGLELQSGLQNYSKKEQCEILAKRLNISFDGARKFIDRFRRT